MVYMELLTAEQAGMSSKMKHGDYLRNENKRIKLKEKWAEFFQSYDIFLCPVANTTALKHDHSEPQIARLITVNGSEVPYVSFLQWAGLIILADLPVTTVPIGMSCKGLPFGVQVVAPAFQDRTSLYVGELLEMHHRKFEPPKLDVARL
eukprot:gnl/MRDRNA2_/MRDRNA2_69033_c0_seq1.p1 gnl/MRDRNA2_/MRDRNA2_69033_c0~~gnl/MRDRNA2_/MRDRNA2_69033_c0_seq1.p1  ORF type:complete len:149 (+),score=34.82 gnl/MRDRNA2_/MRDRNA2_69033_c0_seq1:230-676(+)